MVVLALILGAVGLGVGCGGNTYSEADTAERKASAIQDDPPVRDGDGAIEEILEDVQDGMQAREPVSVCFELSDRAKEALAGGEYETGSCERLVAGVVERQRAADLANGRWKILSVRIGRRAAVAIVARPGQPSARVRVVSESGDWELARLNPLDSSGLWAK